MDLNNAPPCTDRAIASWTHLELLEWAEWYTITSIAKGTRMYSIMYQIVNTTCMWRHERSVKENAK